MDLVIHPTWKTGVLFEISLMLDQFIATVKVTEAIGGDLVVNMVMGMLLDMAIAMSVRTQTMAAEMGKTAFKLLKQ